MLLRSFSLNFEMNARGLAAIDPPEPFGMGEAMTAVH
jgi:hypothetical protein